MKSLLHGIGIGQNLAVGPAIREVQTNAIVSRYYVKPEYIDVELDRLKLAFGAVLKKLENLARNLKVLPNRDPYLILEAHKAMLQDHSFQQAAIERVQRQRINSEWAVQQAVGEIAKVFDSIDDTYLRSRLEDILNLQDMVQEQLQLDQSKKNGESFNTALKGAVLVAESLAPHATLTAIRSGVVGFVLTAGNPSGHSAIIAKSMGVPMVIGIGDDPALQELANGTQVALDAGRGIVVLKPDQETLNEWDGRYKTVGAQWQNATGPLVLKDGTPIAILANVDLAEEITDTKLAAFDGVGLYRTEVAFLGNEAPTETALQEVYTEMFKAVGSKILTFRVLDLGGDKVPGFASPELQRSMASPLGLRGTRYLFEKPELMRRQVRAMIRAADGAQVRVLLPMIAHPSEVRKAKAIIKEAQVQVGDPRTDVSLGMMIETPAAVFSLRQFHPLVDFYNVGTNDLIQFLLAVDRADGRVREYYDDCHPAVWHSLQTIARTAGDKPLTLCGEVAGKATSVALAIGLGYRSFSMSANMIPNVKMNMRKVRLKDCKSLAKHCTQATSATEIRAHLDVFAAKYLAE